MATARQKTPLSKKARAWQVADAAVCVLFWLCNSIWCLSGYMGAYMPLLFSAMILFFCAQTRFFYEEKRSKVFRIVQMTIRLIAYTAAVLFTILPYTMRYDAPWYYPVQRAFYLSGYEKGSTLYELLPETVPYDAEQYDVRFVPQILQGEACVDIRFYTDAEQIAAYRAEAQACGAVEMHDAPESEQERYTVLYERTVQPDGISFEGTEIYRFSNRAYWFFNESEGYFRVYY